MLLMTAGREATLLVGGATTVIVTVARLLSTDLSTASNLKLSRPV